MIKVTPTAKRILEEIELSEKPVAVMGIGIPASGKSAVLNEVAWLAGPGIRAINLDGIRSRFIRLHAGRKLDTFTDQVKYGQIEEYLEFKKIAIIDGLHVEADRRVREIERYRELGALTVGAVFMDTPVKVALERNAAREVPCTDNLIEQLDRVMRTQPPALNEGFDWIIPVKPDETTDLPRV